MNKKVYSIILIIVLISLCLIPLTSAQTNLMLMFQDGTAIGDGCDWGQYNTYGYVKYGTATEQQQIAIRDDIILHNGHSSIRLEAPSQYNLYREVNNHHYIARPRDTVTMTVWVKTAAGSGNAGIIGFDCYGSTHRILEVHTAIPQHDIWITVNGVPTQGGISVYVPYGSDWTKLTLTVTIPETTYTYDDFGAAIPPQTINSIVPWLGGVWNGRESYPDIWFADSELYINEDAPTPTPTTAPPGTTVNPSVTVTPLDLGYFDWIIAFLTDAVTPILIVAFFGWLAIWCYCQFRGKDLDFNWKFWTW